MVDDELDAVFQALAHPVRRGMLARLAAGELTVGELAAPLAMSLAAASKHLDVLERAGLVHRAAHGRTRKCRLDRGPLARAAAWLAIDAVGPSATVNAPATAEPAAIFRSGPVPDGQP